MPTIIDRFMGKYWFLSNFYPAPVEMDGKLWPTVEHAYQACKTNDPVVRGRILIAPKPGTAKYLGQRVRLRENWDEMKLDVMKILVSRKFKELELARKLLATRDAQLVEGNYWGDAFWGVYNGAGENHLGRILMEVRKELQREANP